MISETHQIQVTEHTEAVWLRKKIKGLIVNSQIKLHISSLHYTDIHVHFSRSYVIPKGKVLIRLRGCTGCIETLQ